MALRTTRTLLAATLLALGGLGLGACGSEGGGGDPAPTVTETVTTGAPTSPTTPPATTPPATTTAPATGCPAGGGGVPAGAASRETIDVDGDGRPDTMWLNSAAGPVAFGYTTASGATFSAQVGFAGGSQPNALTARLGAEGPILAFVGNSRVVNLLTVSGCSVVPVTNPQAQPYTFDLGFAGNGTGVGCVDVSGDSALELVGLNVLRDAAGQPSSITRTVIQVTGTTAANGATAQVPLTPEALASAQSVSCGEKTYANSGL